MISSRVGRYCLAHAACPVVAVPPADLDQAAGHGLRGCGLPPPGPFGQPPGVMRPDS